MTDTDKITIKSLKETYDLYNCWDKVDNADEWIEPDYEVLSALKVVIKQYLNAADYKEWEASLKPPRRR